VAAAAAAVVCTAHRPRPPTICGAFLFLTADAPVEIDGELTGDIGLAATVCERARLGRATASRSGMGASTRRRRLLAASDPIAAALFATRRLPRPRPTAVKSARRVGMAEAWEVTWRARRWPARPRARAGLAAGYARVRRPARERCAALAGVAGEALAWLARHARRPWPRNRRNTVLAGLASPHDHGALVDRVPLRGGAAGRAPRTGDAGAAAWLQQFADALSACEDAGQRQRRQVASAGRPLARGVATVLATVLAGAACLARARRPTDQP